MSDEETSDDGRDWWRTVRRFRPTLIVGAIILLIAAFYVRPLFHGVLYSVIYEAPYLIQWTLVGGVFILASRFADTKLRSSGLLVLGAGIIVVMGLIVGPFFASIQTKTHLSDDVLSSKTDIDELPKIDDENPRLLPRSVGRELAENKLQLPQHQLGEGDITFLDGTPHWSFPLKPDGFWNMFNVNQRGGAFVNMSTQTSDVKMFDRQEFKKGVGQALSENYEWDLVNKKYWADYRDPFVVRHEREMYLAVPYVQHDIEYNIGFPPQPYSVPKLGGVAIMDTEGDVEMLSRDEARNSEILEGQRYYPYSLARFRITSVNLRNGFINTITEHEDMFKVSKVPGKGNSQPFTVKTDDGIKYFLATEPYGESSGIYQIWIIDGRTGETALRNFENTTLVGPKKASNYVRKDEPKVNWQRLSPSEPTPVIRNRTMYWQVKVVPIDSTGVSYTAFVNSRTGNVIEYKDDKRVYAFIRGDISQEGDLGDVEGGGGTSEAEGGMVVVILDEDGNPVRTIEVEKNQSVRIERKNESDSGR